MRSKTIVFLIIFGMVFAAALAVANQDRGAVDIVLNGGTKGKVSFPHQKHQDTLTDCNICHDTFPPAPGAIDTLKAEGKLKKKQVMNKLCTKCHKAEKKAGQPSGPTTCKTCHIK
jgi:hypothetical protein